MRKKIIFVVTIFVIIIGLTGCTSKNKVTADSKKFKNEYEKLNGESNSLGQKHRKVSISEDNPFIYATGEEIVKKIENDETFYVYFGSSYCPWCRSVIQTAISSAKDHKVDSIYYVNIWKGDHNEILRDTYKISEEGNVELVSNGTKAYQKLLKYFDSVLSEYTLTNENGEAVPVGEKRIFAPDFIYVKKGNVKKIETGISKKQKNSRDKLTDSILKDQKEKLDKFFSN